MTTTDLAESDRQIRKRLGRERKEFDKLMAAPASQENLSQLEALVESIKTGGKELRSRQTRRQHQELARKLPLQRALREDAEARAKAKAEQTAASQALGLTGPPLGIPVGVDPTRLTSEQGEELLRIARKLHREELTEEEEKRRKELVCVAAGDPEVFLRVDREQALKKKEARLRDQERIAQLPERTYTGRGLAVVPPYLAGWLADRTPGSLNEFGLGILAAILLGLENHVPTLPGSSIEIVDGEAVMVMRGEPGSPNPDDPCPRPLAYLAQNELLSIERGPGGTRISVGARIKKLRGEVN